MVVAEIAALVTSSTPYLTAALSAYGTAVLSKAEDGAADATVSLGRRLLQRIFGIKKENEELPSALAQAASAPDDADALGALRLAIRGALEADPALLAEVRGLLASGQGTVNSTVINSGRDTYYSGHDMTITRGAQPPKPAAPSGPAKPGTGDS